MENKMDKDKRVCVYCSTETYAYICPSCNEYDGLMPIMEAIATYDFIAEAYADEMDNAV
jgi:lipopolysaccharide biosynthesis regulator YciM